MKTAIDLYVIEKIRARRQELDISQEALSYKINRNRTFISSYETGPNKYNVSHLNEIAKVLKCSPQDFLPSKPL